MTTNQTIDGVPRELLERACVNVFRTTGGQKVVDELRALLDSPACKMCGDSSWIPEPFSIRENVLECPECKPAAQPHGEPVHECQKCNGRGSMPTRHAGEGETEYRARCKLYAEQPAPVAVVMPEREMYCQYLRGVIPDNRLEVEAYKDGWNACIDELKRLNPSL